MNDIAQIDNQPGVLLNQEGIKDRMVGGNDDTIGLLKDRWIDGLYG
jgi:hypothetical protein